MWIFVHICFCGEEIISGIWVKPHNTNTNNLIFLWSSSLTIHLIYYFLIKKTVTVGINWINYGSLLASLFLSLSLSLSLCVPWSRLTAHVGKKSNHSFGLHNTHPPAEPQTALGRSSPDTAEHPQRSPRPWPAFPWARWAFQSRAPNYLEDGKADLAGGRFTKSPVCSIFYVHVRVWVNKLRKLRRIIWRTAWKKSAYLTLIWRNWRDQTHVETRAIWFNCMFPS